TTSKVVRLETISKRKITTKSCGYENAASGAGNRRYQSKAQANCSKPRSFSLFFSERTSKPRHFDHQASVLSTTQRRAGRFVFPLGTSGSTPPGRMWP